MRRALGSWLNRCRAAQDMARRSGTAASRPSESSTLRVYRAAELCLLGMQQGEFRTFLNQPCLVRDEEEFDRFVAGQRRAVAEDPSAGQRGA